MTPEKWQQVKIALDTVLEAAPAFRAAKIADVCGGDAELRSEVESLLVFEESDGDSFADSSFSSVIKEVFTDASDAFKNRQIGKYRILREIGAGGMGAVFLAERTDGEYNREVAVKFLRHGFYSPSARQRFVQERQILAKLQHRFIAQLVDGGTTEDSTPYLVMEYVEGIPINVFMAESDLSVRKKLDLFRKVCEAVAYAHRNLIVHRDLKPDNILITADGVPKLLDFGIAKLLSTTDVKATVTRQQALTPEYAAPEQLAGCDVSTVSDVYALGIILYEILTGTHPFRQKNTSAEKIRQSVISDEPTRPSAVGKIQDSIFRIQDSGNEKQNADLEKQNRKLQTANCKLLKGDLDTIILKALRKEPERRYESVELFSQDIKSYLKGFPISARPDTFRYRTGKFISRNPIAVFAVSLAIFSLIGGIIVAGYQAHRANIERARAERRFNDVRTLANSFMFEINQKIGESPIQARELLISRATEYLDNLAEESENDPALASELATSYEKIGDVQAELFKPNSGKTSDALASHRKSLQIRQKLFDAAPDNAARGLDVVKSRLLIADILSMSGQLGEARAEYADTNEFSRRLLTLDSHNVNIRRNLASGYARFGQTILRSGSLSDALANYEKSLEIYQTLADENPQDETLKHSIGVIYSFIGYVKMKIGAMPEAVKYFSDSLNIEEKLTEKEDDLQTRGYLSTAHLYVGVSLSEAGSHVKGISEIQTALTMQQEIFDADKNNFGERNSLADCYTELGIALIENGQFDAAIPNLQKAAENYRTIWETDSQNLPTRRQIAFSQRYLAEAFLQKRDFKNALENARQSLVTMSDLTAADPTNTEWKTDLALCYSSLGEIFLQTGDFKQSFENLQIAEPLFEKAVSDSPENVCIRRELDKLKMNLTKLRAKKIAV